MPQKAMVRTAAMKELKYIFGALMLGGSLLGFALLPAGCDRDDGGKKSGKAGRVAPVEVVAVERGPISLVRTFNGALEAQAEFVAAPKVSGRIERLAVNLADGVQRGQVVAELDNDEYVQAVAQARADLAVTQATLMEARSALQIAGREFERMSTLKKRGVASESQYDASKAALTGKQAALEVAQAQVARAEALLETANIRLGYTKVRADWSGGDDRRLVAERYVDEGYTVPANTSLLLIVQLDPITAVIFVSEKEYAHLRVGQRAELSTDAYPGESFEGSLLRIAPVFREATRQARIELSVDNKDLLLKPGMFIRATIELDRREEAVIVPEAALTRRADQTGIFLLDEASGTVSWRRVEIGIRQGERVEIQGEGLSGQVVSLGHQLVEDGSPVFIADSAGSGQAPRP